MRVAFILPSLANQGPVIVANEIVKHIVAKTAGIDVYYFDDILELSFPCNTHRISINAPIEFARYDVIHTHGIRPDYYVWKNRRQCNTPCVSTVHCQIEKDLRYTYNPFVSFLFSKAWYAFLRKHDTVVVLSETLKRHYRKRIGGGRLTVIHNGRTAPNHDELPIEDRELLTKVRERYKVIGTAAGLTGIKGLDQIIRALPALPDFAFVVIGDGKSRKSLENLSFRLNVHERCLFLGRKPAASRYFSLFDVFALPSLSEGFPLTLLECAELGKPVVCSNIEVLTEFFTEEEVCFFEIHDIEDLVASIRKAWRSRDLLGERIHRRYRQEYTAEIMADRYLRLYANCMR